MRMELSDMLNNWDASLWADGNLWASTPTCMNTDSDEPLDDLLGPGDEPIDYCMGTEGPDYYDEEE